MRFSDVMGECLAFSLSHDGVVVSHGLGPDRIGLKVHFRGARTDVLVERGRDAEGPLWGVGSWRDWPSQQRVGTAEELREALLSLWEAGPRRWL